MFRPWIGKNFGDAANNLDGLRLLILGESHYTPNAEAAGKTNLEETVQGVVDYAINKPYRFYTMLFRLVTGTKRQEVSKEKYENFWHDVAFYNFIPVFLLKGECPTGTQWRSGCDLLPSVLADVRPEAIIVCGLTLWWYVMDTLPGGEAANSSKRDLALVGSARAARIPHITGSHLYKYDSSRPLIRSMLDDALGGRA